MEKDVRLDDNFALSKSIIGKNIRRRSLALVNSTAHVVYICEVLLNLI